MSTWKSTTPYWSYKRPAPRHGGMRPKSRRQLRLDPPHDRLANPKEDPLRPEDGIDITAFWARTRAGLDRYALPVAWGAVALGISLTAWFVFAPVAAPEVPRPEPGYPVRLLDPLWPGATTRDGRRASYVDRAPEDGRPEPPLHTHDREGAPR